MRVGVEVELGVEAGIEVVVGLLWVKMGLRGFFIIPHRNIPLS